MKYLWPLRKNVFWVVLLVSLVWFVGGAGKPSVARAMVPSMAMVHGIHDGKVMPSSCPMKGALPCCQGNGRVALCQASLCDLCVLSAPGEENTVSSSRIQTPAIQFITDSGSTQPRFLLKVQSLHPPFPTKFSFFPTINRPLLI